MKKSISIFSNFDKVVTIKTNEKSLYQLYLFDVNGNEIYQSKIQEQVKTIDLKTITSGIYIIKIVNENSNYAIYKIVL